jgi:hypothetical protein
MSFYARNLVGGDPGKFAIEAKSAVVTKAKILDSGL